MNIEWNIKGLNVYHYQDESGNIYNNTINGVKYEVTVTNPETGVSVSQEGSGILDHPSNPTNFTDINSVSEETVKNWLFSSFGTNGKEQLENSMIEKLTMKENATDVVKPSWLNPITE